MLESTASAARIEANRANARHSTGPRTPEGKSRSSQNAVKHGLFSASLSYAGGPLGEDRDQFDKLLDGLRRDHAPVGMDENQIVDRMADLWWDMARAHRLGQLHLRSRLQQGIDMVVVMKEMAVFNTETARLERSLSRQRKDLWLLQGRHNGAVDRGARKALAAYDQMAAAHLAESVATRARMQAAEAQPADPTTAETQTAPHPPASSPSASLDRRASGGSGLPVRRASGGSGLPVRRASGGSQGEGGTDGPDAGHRPEVGSDPEFGPEFTADTAPKGPTNGSGRAPGDGIGSGA